MQFNYVLHLSFLPASMQKFLKNYHKDLHVAEFQIVAAVLTSLDLI